MKEPALPLHARYEDGEEITSLTGLDEYEGATLRHSEKEGFFIVKTILQKREGRDWMTIKEGQMDEDAGMIKGPHKWSTLFKRGTHRELVTYRAVSVDKAMRLILYALGGDGLREVFKSALDRGGIEAL